VRRAGIRPLRRRRLEAKGGDLVRRNRDALKVDLNPEVSRQRGDGSRIDGDAARVETLSSAP
jgi:hypothetical protein